MSVQTTYDQQHSFYGGNLDAFMHKGAESLLIGPAETGKTLALLTKLHFTALRYPRASLVILRKTLTSTYSTVLRTFEEKVLGEDAPIKLYGGEKAQWYDYPNGSRIWVAGLDKSSRVLSAEHDCVYCNQAEELTLDDWETLTTRTTGRAGHVRYPQTIGDANPSWPQHWMYHRQATRRFFSWHKDNPMLYDPETGEITEQGERSLARLGSLTGLRKTRLFYGKAAQAEGAIYDEYDDSIHLIYADAAPVFYRHIAGVDWGFRNPGAIAVMGIEGKSGAAYIIAQHYHTGKVDDWWRDRALELDEEYGIEAFVCDPSEPAYIEKFRRAGLNAIAGFNAVMPGINAVKTRLADGRLWFVRDSLIMVDESLKAAHKPYRIQDEFASYIWADKRTKDTPVKEDDHGMDTIRYGCAYLDSLGEKQKKRAGAWG